MTTSKSQPSQDVLEFLATLDADFGKKSKKKKEPTDNEIARELNKKFHAKHPALEGGAYGVARPNPEESEAWRPMARVTTVVRQCCQTCGGTTEFVGAEYVKFRSVIQFGGVVSRRVDQLVKPLEISEPLPDLIEEFFENVSRCVGCISVERQAVEILDLFQELPPSQAKLGFDLELQEEGEIQAAPNDSWPLAFRKPTQIGSI